MFKLAESLGSRQGVYCGCEGLYLGSAALIEYRDGRYCLRRENEVAALLAAVDMQLHPGQKPLLPIP